MKPSAKICDEIRCPSYHVYKTGRLRDPMQPLHGGNVEYSGEYTTDRDAVEARVAELNARVE